MQETYGLTGTQRGMLLHSLHLPGSGEYIQQMIGRLHEPLNVPAFRQAWNQLAERHGVLRTSFSFPRSDEPCQQVHPHVALPFEDQDWRSFSNSEQERRLRDYLETDRRTGFDLSKAPLVRLALLHFRDAEYCLVWTSHHALFDGRSRRLLLEEVFVLYEACSRGENLAPAPAPLFKLYIDWLARQDLRRAQGFWRHELKGVCSPTALGIDSRGRSSSDGDEHKGSRAVRLSNSLTESLKGLAREHQLTLNTLLQGAWALLLSRYSGDSEVVFGATRSCRHSTVPGAETMVGLLINTVPIRVTVSEERALLPWLKELRAKWTAIREYEHTPLFKIQEWSEVPGTMPLFETLLVFENFELNAALRAKARGFEQREFQLLGKTNYPLVIGGYVDQQLVMKVDYDCHRFHDDSIARLLGHLGAVLGAMASNPEQRLGELRMLTETERRQILVEWNATDKDYPPDKCIHALFEEQAERKPEAVAVVYDEPLTYRQLNVRANQLAHYLRKRGVGADCLVGICMERSPDLIVAMLGILKAGGAYVPLDPSYPADRLAFMLEDSQARVVLTHERLLPSLSGTRVHPFCLDSDRNSISCLPNQDLDLGVTTDNLAYVMYTSGSTGRPKAVMINHRSVCNYLFWRCDYFPLAESDRVLQKAPLSFDDSVWEIFEPLMVGAQIVMVRSGGHQDSRYLANLIIEDQVTAACFVPSLLQAFLEEPESTNCKSLKRVTTGGETLSIELQELFFELLAVDLHNGYGPTEATIGATFWTCDRRPGQWVVPIGRPIANTQIYLLDPQWRPVPVGVPGELHIGGAGLARGYLNNPDLTAAKFIPDPFSQTAGRRLFRTGDLARYRPDGTLEFLGRIDDQVKIRGVRIEPGEVQAAVCQHPSVEAAIVLVREDARGVRRLVAYVVVPAEKPTDLRGLRQFLAQRLPDYMIPGAFVFLDSLPLTASGKVDRERLQTPNWEQLDAQTDFVAPRTPIEERLGELWCKVLGLTQAGIHDNFFEMGGHSLLATQFMSRLNEAFAVDLPLRTLFEQPTIEGVAVAVTHELMRLAAPHDLDALLERIEGKADKAL
jgi:amino acid adenylation domain-containing protein